MSTFEAFYSGHPLSGAIDCLHAAGTCDVALAVGHTSAVPTGQTAFVEFAFQPDEPVSDTFIRQADLLSGDRAYFTSSVTIVPEPASVALFVTLLFMTGCGTLARSRTTRP